jgi:Fe-S-cluster-containing hydrogenase component 2
MLFEDLSVEEILNLANRNLVNGSSLGTSGTGKRKAGYEPQECQGSGCREACINQATTSINGATKEDG